MSIARNRVQVMLDDETYDALREAAQDENATVSDFLRRHIKELLNITD